MKTTATKWATKAAGAGAMVLLLAAPAFAQSRGDWNRNDNGHQTAARSRDQFNNYNSGYRENQRVTASGKITSFARERDGYRVRLDRGGSYWVPESRARGLRVGLSINIGGVFRGGSVYVDTIGYDTAYDNAYVRGVVDRVDYRTGTIWLRDQASRREVRADVGSGRALRNLHRGEFVELTGQWIGNGIFSAERVIQS